MASLLSLSTDQVAAFVELARQGSLRQAAQVLHITEQGVTQAEAWHNACRQARALGMLR